MFSYELTLAADSYEINLENPIDSSQLKATKITPVFDTKITTGENLIYSSTFQMAWNSLCKDFLKDKTAEIEDSFDYAKTLNSRINEPLNIPKDSCFAISGTAKEKIIEKINNNQLNKNIKIDQTLSDDSIMLIANMKKNITFEHEFEKLYIHENFYNVPEKRFEEDYYKYLIQIEWFGIDDYDRDNAKHQLLKKQFEVLYKNSISYSNEPNALPTGFILKLISTSKNDDIFLSTIEPKNTLAETYKMIDDLINKNYLSYINVNNIDADTEEKAKKSFLKKISNAVAGLCTFPNFGYGTILKIPEIKINIQHNYFNKIKTVTGNNALINKLTQYICFEMINKNNPVKKIEHSGVGSYGNNSPNLSINVPFIIILRNKSSQYPYFMAYICNEEFLVKSKKNRKRLRKLGRDRYPGSSYEFTDEVNIEKIDLNKYNIMDL